MCRHVLRPDVRLYLKLTMKRYKLTLLFLITLLLLFSCSPAQTGQEGQGDKGQAQSSEPTEVCEYEPIEDALSLMIYICGSNLESKSGAASQNIDEMLLADIPENARVFIQTGGTEHWQRHDISPDHSNRYEIIDGELVLLEQSPSVNMGLASSLSDFLLWGHSIYPAENIGVILWDHGGGSIEGACTDEQFYNDTLTLPELATALDTVYKKTEAKYEFVGFDACLMATYDMACILEPYANYMIASQDLEPLSGWKYDTLISNLGSDSFYSDVLDAYGKKHVGQTSYTLSVIDLDKLDEIDKLINQCVLKLKEDVAFLNSAFSCAMEFGAGNFGDPTNLFDLGDVASNLDLDHSLSSFIQTANGSENTNASGISLYFPIEQYDYIELYEDVCQSQSYLDALAELLGGKPETPVKITNPGFDNAGRFSFTIAKESEKYVQNAGYLLYGSEAVELSTNPFCYGIDSDVLYKNGTYTVCFEGNWLFLQGIRLHTYIYSIEPARIVYSTPVAIGEEVCYLLFTYYKPTQTVSVEGYVIISDTTSRIHSLTDGMELAVLHEGVADDNSVFFHETGTVIWDSAKPPEVKKVEPGYYRIIPYIYDIYGNYYFGSIATVHFDGSQCRLEDVERY